MSETPINTDQGYVEKNEGEYLSPLESVMSYARESVFAVAPHFEAAGASKEITESAANLASESAKTEFEAKKAEDPIRRLIEALQKVAAEGTDKDFIENGIRNLEIDRSAWKQAITSLKAKARLEGTLSDFSLDESIEKIVNESHPPTYVDKKPNDFTGRVHFEVLRSDPFSNKGPSREVVNEVLRNLGTLQPEEDISVLNQLQSIMEHEDNYGKPSFNMVSNNKGELADFLPTNLPGVTSRLWHNIELDFYSVSVRVDNPTLKKIIEFPKSLS
ncbi:MAG: hypothetical protein ABII80_01720 [bacterium]